MEGDAVLAAGCVGRLLTDRSLGWPSPDLCGHRGIAGLGRKFRIIDDDGNRQLSLSEFTKAIHEHALNLSETEIEELFRFIDTDGSGGINFDEFLLAIRVRGTACVW